MTKTEPPGQLLDTARAELLTLEADTPKLGENLKTQTEALEASRRAARSGTAKFEAVVEQQARMEAARGMLGQHLQDVAAALALVDELALALDAEQTLEEGRAAHALMRQLEITHAQEAGKLDGTLSRGLAVLAELREQHRAAHARLSAAAHHAIAAAHGPTGDVYGDRPSFQPTPERETGLAFLGEIDPTLTEAAAYRFAELPLPALLSQVAAPHA